MDRVKLEKQITANMKAIFGFALTRLGNVREAEYLASDILYELIRSAANLKDEERFYGFMWKIAENTYKEYLRKKAKSAGKTAQLDENIADESDSALEKISKKEDLNLLRRELSLLSKQYRDTTVLYYIENFSCSEVSKRLNISVEMVKYYLFRARKIKGNILLAAYYSPVTIQEISVELGVSLPYLEDEINLLMDRQYLVCKNGKYLTNIPIFTLDCTKAINGKLKELTEVTAEKFIAVSDEFYARFGDRFGNENLARWQKVLMCLHFSLMDTENDLEKNYGELPDDGPYSLVNGGGGCGIIWGRSEENIADINLPKGIQGIYNKCPSGDGLGSVIAMNFKQTLNAQHFNGNMTDSVVRTAVDCYDQLPDGWKKQMETLGYANNGKANFAVWSPQEYDQLRAMLAENIAIVSELNRKTSEIAAAVTADLAPAHIRKTAEYVGALVYRFNSAENLVDTLCAMNWLKAVENHEKPAVCVVKN